MSRCSRFFKGSRVLHEILYAEGDTSRLIISYEWMGWAVCENCLFPLLPPGLMNCSRAFTCATFLEEQFAWKGEKKNYYNWSTVFTFIL